MAITNVMERSMNQPQREPDVKILSLGFSLRSLISKEDAEKIKTYREKHFSLRGVPDHMEMKRLELYVSNVSQSSASSLEIAQQAVMTRRIENASGSALSEIGKRSRRLKSKKLSRKRRRQEIQDDVTAAKLVGKEEKRLSVNSEHVAIKRERMPLIFLEIIWHT